MAFLEGLKFTGKLGELSAYRMRGCAKIVVRRKGGPSADQIKKSPNFKNTRYTMSEFGGCSRMGKHVRYALHPLKALSDNNFGSDINSVMRKVQLQDSTSLWGRRNIILSDHARILEGFPLNSEQPTFDSVVRNPVYYKIDRASRSATVDIPALLRGINYFPQNGHAMFRVIVTLGIVPDMTYDVVSREYQPPAWFDAGYFPERVDTPWYPSLEGMPATTLALEIKGIPPEDRWSLMLSIGIQYGSLREGAEIKEVKRFGAAKIMALIGRSNNPDVLLASAETQTSALVEVPTDAVPEVATQNATAPAMKEANIEGPQITAASGLTTEEASTQAFCYHYVSTAAPVAQPVAATYTYSYTMAEKRVAPVEVVKAKYHGEPPAPAVEISKASVYPGSVPAANLLGAIAGSMYKAPNSTIGGSSSRYITFGQWRL